MRALACGIAIVLLGCSGKKTEPGADWAKATFGAGKAAEFRSNFHDPEIPAPGKPYAPRPIVILEFKPYDAINYKEGPPDFHALNAQLPPGLAPRSAEEVRTIVYVKRVTQERMLNSYRIRGQTFHDWEKKELQMVAVRVRGADGRFATAGSDVIEGHDPARLLAYLKGLPETPP